MSVAEVDEIGEGRAGADADAEERRRLEKTWWSPKGLRGWLTDNVYRHGRKFRPNELVVRATGEELQTRSYMKYLRAKFGVKRVRKCDAIH